VTTLEAELSERLGDKQDPAGRNWGNSRNGTCTKTPLTVIRPVQIEVPRDQEGSFERETSAHCTEVYGTAVSRDTISRITDKVIEELALSANRPLAAQSQPKIKQGDQHQLRSLVNTGV
jgi:transposase-like protein